MSAQDLTILMNTDRLSWHRVGMVARFYWPRLRMQLLCFFLVMLAVSLLARILSTAGSPEQIVLISMPVTVLQYCFLFAPVVLAFRNDQANCVTLPALGSEKCIFLIFWFFIVVPAALLIPLKLCYFDISLTEYYSRINIDNINLENMMPRWALLSNIINSVAWTATCFWIVCASHRRRAVKAVLIPIGLMILYGMIIGAITITKTINLYGISANDTNIDPQIAVNSAVDIMNTILPGIMICATIYSVFAIIMACRAICRKQI